MVWPNSFQLFEFRAPMHASKDFILIATVGIKRMNLSRVRFVSWKVKGNKSRGTKKPC